jgi:flagellar hook-length control protein FliK
LAAAQGAQLARSNLEGNAVSNHVTDNLQSPVTSPQFADELAEKVTMFMRMAKDDGTMTAELHLNPAEMGPINIKIALDGQNAQIDFAAAALETRQALEASMPLLSSALDEVGLSLTGGGVSSQAQQQGFGQAFSQSGGSSPDGRSTGRVGRTGPDGQDEPVTRSVNVARLTQKGGLDLYA